MPQWDVQHWSQFGWGLSNLCGQSQVANLVATLTGLRPTPKEVAYATGTADNQPRNFADMVRMANHFGVRLIYHNAATIQWVRQMLDEGRPPILLVAYEQFSNRPNTYTAAHFLTATGYTDNTFTLNDSLQSKGSWVVSAKDLEKALNTPSTIQGGANRPNQALVPEQRITAMLGGFNYDIFHHNGAPPAALMKGTQFARVEFKVSRANGHHSNRDIDLAVSKYADYLRDLKANGIRILMIFTHITFGEFEGQGGYDFKTMAGINAEHKAALVKEYFEGRGEWVRYRNESMPFFGQCLDKLIAVLGSSFDVQFKNQMDGDERITDSVRVPARIYGDLFKHFKAEVRKRSSNMRVITGGHVTDAITARKYISESGVIGVADGIALHPYLKTANSYPLAGHDSLENYLNSIRQTTGTATLWITEFGGFRGINISRESMVAFSKAFLAVTNARGIAAMFYAVGDTMDACPGPYANGQVILDKYGQSLIDVFKGGYVTTPPPTVPAPDPGEVLVTGELDIVTPPNALPVKLRLRTAPSVNAPQVGNEFIVDGLEITAYSKKHDDGVYEWTYNGKGWFASREKKGGWSSRVKKVTVSYTPL